MWIHMNLIYVSGLADQKTQNGPMSPTLLVKIPNVISINGTKTLNMFLRSLSTIRTTKVNFGSTNTMYNYICVEVRLLRHL